MNSENIHALAIGEPVGGVYSKYYFCAIHALTELRVHKKKTVTYTVENVGGDSHWARSCIRGDISWVKLTSSF